MRPQETLYVPHRGVLPAAQSLPTRKSGVPVLALILVFCAVGWLALGVLLLVVDSHSWDIIVPSMVVGTGSYLVLARWAHRDWKHPIPRNLDTVRKV